MTGTSESSTMTQSADGRFMCVVILLIVADLARHGLILALGPAPILLDSVGYWATAEAVVAGDWFQMGIDAPYRTPAYAYLVAVQRACFGQYALLAAVLWQHAAVLATTWTTAFACLWAWQGRWGFVIGYALSLTCLTRLWCANFLLTETVFTLFFTAGMASLLLAAHSPHFRFPAAAGILLGLATLVRPVPQLLVPALAGLLLFPGDRSEGRPATVRRAAQAGLLLLLFGLLLIPCFLRNRMLYGEIFLTKLPAANKWAVAFRDGSGGNLPWPDSPAARELSTALGLPEETPLNDRHPYELRDELEAAGMPREQAEALLARAALDAIFTWPGRFSWMAFKRNVNFWRCVADHPPHGRGLAPDFQGQFTWRSASVTRWLLPWLDWAPARWLWWNQLFSLAAWIAAFSLLWRRETRIFGWITVATFSYFCLLTGLVEIENYRYRMILEPFMVICLMLTRYRRPEGGGRQPLDHGPNDVRIGGLTPPRSPI